MLACSWPSIPKAWFAFTFSIHSTTLCPSERVFSMHTCGKLSVDHWNYSFSCLETVMLYAHTLIVSRAKLCVFLIENDLRALQGGGLFEQKVRTKSKRFQSPLCACCEFFAVNLARVHSHFSILSRCLNASIVQRLCLGCIDCL